MKVDTNRRLMVIVNRSVEHPSVPVDSKYVRVHTYMSEMVIRPHTTFDEVWCAVFPTRWWLLFQGAVRPNMLVCYFWSLDRCIWCGNWDHICNKICHFQTRGILEHAVPVSVSFSDTLQGLEEVFVLMDKWCKILTDSCAFYNANVKN